MFIAFLGKIKPRRFYLMSDEKNETTEQRSQYDEIHDIGSITTDNGKHKIFKKHCKTRT